MASASEKNTMQPDQELLNMINDWKSKTRVGKFDRIKKMVFSFNQRPTDFKPADFFPPIPDLEIASDSEEKTIDKIDRERKSLSKRKLDYENLVEVDEMIEIQATPEDEDNGLSLDDNEKQRRQPISNEFTDLNQFSPINSPTKTNRNLIKLNRESLLKQIQNDENIQTSNQHSKNSDKKSNISLKKKSLNESNSKLSSSKNPIQLSNVHNETINKEPSSVNKSKYDQQVETQENKENIVVKSSNNDELNLFNPPTPPQAQPTQNQQHLLQILPNQSVTRSSITITKRRSAEPVRDILVDLSNVSTKPKVLSKQKAITKINESMNESQTELLTSQSNTYIRRKSTFNNKTVNSTVNSSASVLFKPVKSNIARNLNNLPQAPLFTHEKGNNSREHETSSDNNSLEIKKKKVRNKKSTKQKQQQKSKENDSKNDDSIDLSNKEQKELKTNKNGKEKDLVVDKFIKASQNNKDLIPEKEVVVEQIETDQKSIENRKKSSKNVDDDDDDDDGDDYVKLIDKSKSKVNEKTSPSIKTKNISKQQKKNKKENTPKKNKNTNKTRQPLKNIQNQEEKVPKTRTNSQKEIGYFLNNKTIPYEHKLTDECENEGPLSLRRSKRAKIDKNSQPIYGYEEISDYRGNKCIVRKVIGTKDKIDIKINKELMRINHYFTETKNKKPKERKKKLDKKNLDKTQTKISDAFKKLEKTQEILQKEANNQIYDHDLLSESIEEPNRMEPIRSEASVNLVLPLNPVNEQQVNLNLNLNDQDNNLQEENSKLNIEESLSCSINSNVNSSIEFIFSKKDGTTLPINPYFFHKNIEKKTFQNYSKGVQISPISDMTGVLRINGLSSTKTNYHDFAVNYFVQNGSFLFSLNGILSIHHEKDVIYIPKNTPYKIKNVSDNEQNSAYVYFRFEN